MPDLTTEYYWQCETTEWYQTKVLGKGGEYTVTFGPTPFGEYQHDWSCTCKAFQFGKGKPCKHIHSVKASGEHCGWMQFTEGGEPVSKHGKHFCPKCGAKAESRGWGV